MRFMESTLLVLLINRYTEMVVETLATSETREGCRNAANRDACNITKILTNILKGYDKRLRPFLNDRKPATITIGIWILSIDSINVINMDYRIDLFFRQAWTDPRLKHSYPEPLTLANSMLDKLWVPDTYFENSKSSNFHFVTVPNKMLRITQDGKVMYNSRISLRASCPMNLRDFPVDSQRCELHIESYGYDIRHIKYQWEDGKSRVSIDKKLQNLPQYNLTDFETMWTVSHYVIGNWSSLKIKYTLKRQSGHFFLHLYAPCILIVMLSWISFFIPRDSVAARIALGITSVLTTTTILNIQNTSMPKVSYIKLADWYLIVCFLFVFGTLVEFTVILYLNAKEKRRELQNNEAKKALAKEVSKKLTLGNRNIYPNTNETIYGTKAPVALLLERNERQQESRCPEIETDPPKKCASFKIEYIDEYSRMFFPISFLIFNSIYWLLYFIKKS